MREFINIINEELGDIPDATLDPRIDPQVREFLKVANADPRPYWLLPVDQVQATLTKLQDHYPVDMSGVEIKKTTIMHDGRPLSVYVFKPAGAGGQLPLMFFIHGGAWIAGNFENHKRFVRDLVVGAGVVAVFPEYTSIPEAVYPTQLEQCYTAFQWAMSHAREIGIDPTRIALAGNSVGGNMTAAMTMLLKERGGPQAQLQILFWPATDANIDTESYHLFATGRFLARDFMKFSWAIYAPTEELRNDPHVCPLRANTEQLMGLPPALIQTEENDPLRDEGEAYARKLSNAGVPVVSTRYSGQIHDFGILNGVRNVPSTQDAIDQAIRMLKKYLGLSI